ncbi:alginate lyase family protein [Zavarzinia sp. CC-PAN008]|uniref:alginate lyase family protein n=1 Tax=Zavarzinia sp. CC-PAN008 TaxID=3243332 RepID=UPI003F7455B4
MTMRAPILALLVLLVPVGSSWAAALQPPFDVAAARSRAGEPARDSFACRSPPEPVRDLVMRSKYKPNTDSTEIDRDQEAANRAADKPIRDFANGLTKMANAYVRSQPPAPPVAACAVTWLADWARAQALTQPPDANAAVRAWNLPTFAMAWLQVRDDPAITDADRNAILAWFRVLAENIVATVDADPDRASHNNNHRYWAGWAVMAAAVALDDRPLFDWAVESYRVGIRQVTADGTLPLELHRRQRALGYHLFALAPLVYMAETAAANGLDLYAENGNALLRLERRTLDGLHDPAPFQALTGFGQDLRRQGSASQMAWLVPFARRFPEPRLSQWRSALDRFSAPAAGGDTELLYGPLPGR